MLKFIAAAGLGALIVAAPLVAAAETTAAPVAHHHQAHRSTGSHRSEMRKRHTTAHERARASAEHMRQMRNQ